MNLEAYLYYLQIKTQDSFEQYIHLSIYKRTFASGKKREKGSFLQDNGEWNFVAKNNYIK